MFDDFYSPYSRGYGGARGGGFGRPFREDYCNFFMKMGACRHGDGCNKIHYHPPVSQTVLLPMMYPNPLAIQHLQDETGRSRTIDFDEKYLRKHFERFYADVFQTVLEFGDISELKVCENLCDHLLGNVYIKFETEQGAINAVDGLKKKVYHDVILLPEFSPLRDFAEAICKEHRDSYCTRGNACNFLHIKKVSPELMDKLMRLQEKKKERRERKAREREEKEKDREKDKKRKSSRERERSGSRDRHKKDRERHRDRHRSDSRERDRKRDEGRRRSPPAPLPSQPPGRAEKCHICGKTGHIGRDCPLKGR